MSLLDIQKKLKVPKNQFNDFGGYKYRSSEDILEAVKPLLDSPLTMTDDIIDVGGRIYVKATATYEGHSVSGWAREAEDRKSMDVAQITGAASSYARKYALNGLFCIDDTKDADYINRKEPEKSNPKVKYITSSQAADAEAMIEELGLNYREVMKAARLSEICFCPAERYKGFINFIRNMGGQK